MNKREATDLAYSVFNNYKNDPVNTMQRLITLYGRSDAEKIITILEEVCPRLFDDAA